MAIQKIIRGEEGGEFSRWEEPVVQAKPGQAKPLSVRELEALQKQAYDEGYAQGKQAGFAAGQKEGVAAGQKEGQELMRRAARVLDLLAKPAAELDDQVEDQLARLALLLAQQIVRRELQTQPGEIVACVREAVALLPLSSREVKVHLHPDDARLLREAVGQGEQEQAWKVVEDPALSRGGCRVTTPASVIDATLERRLAVLASELLGGNRDDDEGDTK